MNARASPEMLLMYNILCYCNRFFMDSKKQSLPKIRITAGGNFQICFVMPILTDTSV